MDTKEAVIPINKIVVDADLYPRTKHNWMVAYSYSKAMEAGAIFPPIFVAKQNGKYTLIDGNHRIEAMKIRKETHIKAVIMYKLTKEEIFENAVRMNVVHGYQLSPFDKATAISKMRVMGFTEARISGIINIPIASMTTFVARRLTSTLTGEEIILKAPLKHLSGIPVGEDINEIQDIFSSQTQTILLDQVITLLENKTFLKDTPMIQERLEKIYNSIGVYLGQQKIPVNEVTLG